MNYMNKSLKMTNYLDILSLRKKHHQNHWKMKKNMGFTSNNKISYHFNLRAYFRLYLLQNAFFQWQFIWVKTDKIILNDY